MADAARLGSRGLPSTTAVAVTLGTPALSRRAGALEPSQDVTATTAAGPGTTLRSALSVTAGRRAIEGRSKPRTPSADADAERAATAGPTDLLATAEDFAAPFRTLADELVGVGREGPARPADGDAEAAASALVESDASANASAGTDASAPPMPSAIASAPTRPTDNIDAALVDRKIPVEDETACEIPIPTPVVVAEGHSEAAFVIVGSGPHGADPHHECSERELQAGE